VLKHADPEATIVGLDAIDEIDEIVQYSELDELELVKLEIRELRDELGATREKLEEVLTLATRWDRLRVVSHSRRQRRTRGAAIARGILRVMVAVFTLAGTIAGIGAGAAVIYVLGPRPVAIVAAGIFGLAIALGAWLAASLAALVLETADSVRDLP
jgi:hypothetical protein